MRYLKVKIKREQNPGGGTHYVYPAQYDAQAVLFGPNYETFNVKKLNEVKSRVVPHEFCVIAVSDEDAEKFLASPDIVEMTENAFIVDGEDYSSEAVDIIDDEQEVLKVLNKITKGIPLNQKDLDVIDGTKTDRGIRKTKTFSEKWLARKQELGA